MNYLRIYNELMHNAKTRANQPIGYCEWHHILPKSMGGSDNANNLVLLSAREHFIAHLLLCRITTSKDKQKMSYAMMRMCKHAKTSRQFALASSAISKGLKGMPAWNKGVPHSDEAKAKMSKARAGRKQSAEHNANIGKALKGKLKSAEHKANIVKGKLGKKLTEEHKANIGKGQKGKPKSPIIDFCLISPIGEIICNDGQSIANFAICHGLNRNCLRRLLKDQHYQHKGWRLFKPEQIDV